MCSVVYGGNRRERKFKKVNNYYNPVRTLQGFQSLNQLPAMMGDLVSDEKCVLLLVWNKCVLEVKAFQEITAIYGDRLIVREFETPILEIDQVFELYQEVKTSNIGLVLGAGGGSVLDLAKALCCIYDKKLSSLEDLRTLLEEGIYGNPAFSWIGIPTTAGTGNEVSCTANIWDCKNDIKYAMVAEQNYAAVASIDPELVKTMPIGLEVSAAMDALAHAAESYWALNTNAVSRGLALSSISLIMEHIGDLLVEEKKQEAREYISQGSLMAGLAFSNTGATACNSISYALMMHYRIPHGVAVGLLLAPVLEVNLSKVENLDALMGAFGVKNSSELHQKILNLLKAAGYHRKVRHWGGKEEDIPTLVEQSILEGCVENNPVDLTPELVQAIIETIL